MWSQHVTHHFRLNSALSRRSIVSFQPRCFFLQQDNMTAACFLHHENFFPNDDTGYFDFMDDFLPGGVGQRDRGAWGPMSPAASWWGAQPGASPGGFWPTPWVLPLIWSPHDWNNLFLWGRLHRPAEKMINDWLVTSGSVKTNLSFYHFNMYSHLV